MDRPSHPTMTVQTWLSSQKTTDLLGHPGASTTQREPCPAHSSTGGPGCSSQPGPCTFGPLGRISGSSAHTMREQGCQERRACSAAGGHLPQRRVHAAAAHCPCKSLQSAFLLIPSSPIGETQQPSHHSQVRKRTLPLMIDLPCGHKVRE